MTKVAKKKVGSLAKQFEVPVELLIRILRDAGTEVRSHLSSIDSVTFGKVKDTLLSEKAKLGKGRVKTSVKKAPTKTAASKDEIASRPKATLKKKPAKVTITKATIKKKSVEETEKVESVEAPVVEVPVVESKVSEKLAFVAEVPVVDTSAVEESEVPTPSAEKVATGEHVVRAPEPPGPLVEPVQPQLADKVGTAEVHEKKETLEKKKSDAPVYKPKESSLKVTIEKPNAEMQARIEKYNQSQAQRRGGALGVGYTGTFGRQQRPSRPDDKGRGSGSPGGGRGGYSGGSGGGGQGGPGRGGYSGGPGAGQGGPGRGGYSGGPGAGQGGPGRGGYSGGPGAGQGGPGAGQGGPGRGGYSGGPGAGQGGPGRGGFGGGPGGPGGMPGGSAGKRRKKRKRAVKQTKEEMMEMRQSVNRVMASLGKTGKKSHKKDEVEEGVEIEKQILEVSDFITVAELAGLLEQMPNMVIAKCMELGLMVTINYRLDFETIQLIADEFGFEAQLMEEYEEEISEEQEEEKLEGTESRPPVVTVMGHVDHGKTSILDWVRDSNVVDGESGGITQHISAYQVETPNGSVTFLDTPGHEAFSSMRARGSQATDVVVLVVAADSHVMPQTIESIEHAKAAKVPIVVAINKCDLDTANPDRIRGQLAEHGVEVEQWGGQTSCLEVSAKTGAGMEKLLETLALESEVLELKANADGKARGVVIESYVDRGRGVVATILIQSGTLKVGDPIVAGVFHGRVRAMLNDQGKNMDEAGPSTPVQVLGLAGVPQSGDALIAQENEKVARDLAGRRESAAKERELRSRQHISLELMHDRVKSGEFSEFNLIIKADVDGSVEAIASSLEKLSNKEVKVNIIRKAVGAVNESDILLASASNAVVIAFHVLPNQQVRDKADEAGIEIKLYRVIYEIIEEVQGVLEGMLKPSVTEKVVGEAEIKQLFKVSKIGMIAGSFVHSGTVDLNSKLRIYRSGIEVGVASVTSLKRHKDDVEQVKSGMECGIGLRDAKDIRVGDTLAFFRVEEVVRTLSDVES